MAGLGLMGPLPRELLATPMESVKRILTVKPESVEKIGDREFLSIDGSVVNVLRLDRFLNLSPTAESSGRFLILHRRSSIPVHAAVDVPAAVTPKICG